MGLFGAIKGAFKSAGKAAGAGLRAAGNAAKAGFSATKKIGRTIGRSAKKITGKILRSAGTAIKSGLSLGKKVAEKALKLAGMAAKATFSAVKTVARITVEATKKVAFVAAHTLRAAGAAALALGQLSVAVGVTILSCPLQLLPGCRKRYKQQFPNKSFGDNGKPISGLSKVQDYGYWCGGNTAPAKKPKDLEKDIEDDESGWDAWVKKNNLPPPIDAVDHACMLHDLRLGRARKNQKPPPPPELTAFTRDAGISKINQQLAADFAKQQFNPRNCGPGMAFASRGVSAFIGMTEWTRPLKNSKAGMEAARGAISGLGPINTSSGATTGAYKSVVR